MKKLHLIAACQNTDWGIAQNGSIPWKSSHDLEFFKRITCGTDITKKNAIIMGRKTFDTIKKLLPLRENYIITRNQQLLKEEHYYNSLHAAITAANVNSIINEIFIIGGEEIYREALVHYWKIVHTIYITRITTCFPCDQFFPIDLLTTYFTRSESICKQYETLIYFEKYHIKNDSEKEYLNLIKRVLENGDQRVDRTGVGTISIFGEKMVFDISESFPLLTTKKLPFTMIAKELLWFLSGSTDSNILLKDGIGIWKGNTSREFLDSRGLTHLPVGDIGAGYGHQWRHFGSPYVTCRNDYSNTGVDQIKQVIDLIKTDPTSRRILFTGWNPQALNIMALPPCHSIVVQFYVREGFLDCQMYQRSGDIGLGIPFNIASYALLVYMIAHVTNLRPGKLIHIIGDAHIYTNHIDSLREQLTRLMFVCPKLEIIRCVPNIDAFTIDDFRLIDYTSHPSIKMTMAV